MICSFVSRFLPIHESISLVLYVAKPSLTTQVSKSSFFLTDISCLSCSGIPKGCNKEFLWTGLHPDACSVNSPSGVRDKERVSCGCLDCGVVSSLVGGLCERNSAAGWRDMLTTNCLLVTPGLLISSLPPAPGHRPALDCDWLLLPVTSDSHRRPCWVAPPSRELAYDTGTVAIHFRILYILWEIPVTNSTVWPRIHTLNFK